MSSPWMLVKVVARGGGLWYGCEGMFGGISAESYVELAVWLLTFENGLR